MAFGFHGGGKEVRKSTLTGFVAGFDFVDHVDLAAATDDLARRVTLLRRFDGGDNFHKRGENTGRDRVCQTETWPRLASVKKDRRMISCV
jgi:hypothetical protein